MTADRPARRPLSRVGWVVVIGLVGIIVLLGAMGERGSTTPSPSPTARASDPLVRPSSDP